MGKRRVAIYIRAVAADVDYLLLELRHYCNECNWEISNEYIDLISDDGLKVPLKRLGSLLKDCKLDQFDIVLFYKLEAFGWESIDFTFKILQQLKNNKMHWHSFLEPIFSTIGTHADLMFEYMEIFQSVNSNMLSRKTKEKLQIAKNRGIRLGRSPIPLETEQQIIERRKMGESFSQIQKHVSYQDSQGHLRHPSKGSISKILNKHSQQFKNGVD